MQLDKLNDNLVRRQRNFALTAKHVARWPHLFTLPRLTEGIETGWHMFPFIINPTCGIRRGELQRFMEGRGIDTRMVWTGNAARQPAFRDKLFRQPTNGLPNADLIMEQGLILPNSHSMSDEDCNYIGECLAYFVNQIGLS